MTKSRQIMADDNCLDGTGAGSPVRIVKCHGLRGNQVTSYSVASMDYVVGNLFSFKDKILGKKEDFFLR